MHQLRCCCSINYVKHLPDGVCFTDAVLAPFGCGASHLAMRPGRSHPPLSPSAAGTMHPS